MPSDVHTTGSPCPVSEDALVDNELQSLREQLQRAKAPDLSVVVALSAALRRRFFAGSGRLGDLKEALSLLDNIPRPTLEDIGTSAITFHPDIDPSEQNWVQWQPWLRDQGYMLPARYHPDWVPSWCNSGDPTDKFISPDGVGSQNDKIVDAVRICDDQRVFMKVVLCNTDQELDIAAYFSSEPMRSDPRNHCYPLLDVLCPPLLEGERHYILVFPLLRRVFDPDPETIEELLSCISMLAEGLAFMHEHNAAHRDIHFRNVMMDATQLMPEGWHPWMHDWVYPPGEKARPLTVLSRSRVTVRYFLIDFGLSVKFASFEERSLVTGLGGLNRGLPEQSATVPYDPFAADIRMFGDMLRDWQTGFIGLEFLDPLLATLCCDDPSARLTAPQMVRMLDDVICRRSRIALKLPLRRRSSPSRPKVWLDFLTRVLFDGTKA